MLFQVVLGAFWGLEGFLGVSRKIEKVSERCQKVSGSFQRYTQGESGSFQWRLRGYQNRSVSRAGMENVPEFHDISLFTPPWV